MLDLSCSFSGEIYNRAQMLNLIKSFFHFTKCDSCLGKYG